MNLSDLNTRISETKLKIVSTKIWVYLDSSEDIFSSTHSSHFPYLDRVSFACLSQYKLYIFTVFDLLSVIGFISIQLESLLTLFVPPQHKVQTTSESEIGIVKSQLIFDPIPMSLLDAIETWICTKAICSFLSAIHVRLFAVKVGNFPSKAPIIAITSADLLVNPLRSDEKWGETSQHSDWRVGWRSSEWLNNHNHFIVSNERIKIIDELFLFNSLDCANCWCLLLVVSCSSGPSLGWDIM